jgi:phospholipid/cholesterol/gamma-HCH transport system ATP-binding protein
VSQPVLELKNVSVVLGGEYILKGINLSVQKGETIVLIGPSGSGKSVLLKTLAGIYDPYEGESFCEGHSWKQMSVLGKHDLAAKVGVQFQRGALFDHLSAAENIEFPLREHLKLSEDEIARRVKECLSAVDLEKSAGLMPHEMSGGMRQRLSVARAIALQPEILFFDDPTAGLDPLNSDKMAELLVALKNKIGATMVVVTHDMYRAYQLAGRIFLVGNQSVIDCGNAEQTRNHADARVQQFIQGKMTGPLNWG